MTGTPLIPILDWSWLWAKPEERPHHPFSPSWLQNGEYCPHYQSDQKKTPHVRTLIGTMAHKMTETRSDNDDISDDDALLVAKCLDFYDKKKAVLEKEGTEAFQAAFDLAFSTREGETPSPENFRITEGTETYLPIDDLSFPDCESTTAGYVDRYILSWDKKRGFLIDWKFGRWAVSEAKDNLQGMAYALGLFKKFPTLDSIEVTFYQPLINFLTAHTFTRADVPSMYLRIKNVVARARLAREKADFSMANPGTPICAFCKHVGACPKVTEFACSVGKKFHPLGIPENINPTLVQDPSNVKLGLELAATLKVWAEAFRRQATERVIRGEAPIPEGQEIRTMQKRELVDLMAYKKLALNHLTPEEWESCLDTTFGAVEKIISKKAPRGEKEHTVETFQTQAAAAGATKFGQQFSFLATKSEKKTTEKTN